MRSRASSGPSRRPARATPEAVARDRDELLGLLGAPARARCSCLTSREPARSSPAPPGSSARSLTRALARRGRRGARARPHRAAWTRSRPTRRSTAPTCGIPTPSPARSSRRGRKWSSTWRRARVIPPTRPGARRWSRTRSSAPQTCSRRCARSRPRLVHVGGALEYGHRRRPLRETDAPAPVTFRGAAKSAATLLALEHAHATGTPVTVLRPFAVYGPWERPPRFVAAVRPGRAAR